MAFTRMLRNLIRDPDLGPRIVPIIPDEARTFGMDPLFNEVGIYASGGQRYEPVDSELVMKYREAKDGQVLEEGITEAGSMASFAAAATSYSTHGLPIIPFYIFYSMFGFQRTGDQIWARRRRPRPRLPDGRDRRPDHARRARASSTTTGTATSWRPRSRTSASTTRRSPTSSPRSIRDGIERMYARGEDVFYYVTLYNENYAQAARPEGIEDGILRGIYRFAAAPDAGKGTRRPPGSWAPAPSSSRCSRRSGSSPRSSGLPPRSTPRRRSRSSAATRSRRIAGTGSTRRRRPACRTSRRSSARTAARSSRRRTG